MLHPLPDPATDAAAVSSAHYCRGCGKRWLTRHRPSCVFRSANPYVLTFDCLPADAPAPWPLDRQQRTAPHGDLR